MKKIKPVHPGEILNKEFLIPLGIGQDKLSKDICVSKTKIQNIIDGKEDITENLSLKLSEYFGTSSGFWINFQDLYNIEKILWE